MGSRSEYKRKYYEEHRDKCRAYFARYYAEHRDKARATHDAYVAQPRGDTYAWMRSARLQARRTKGELAEAAGCRQSHICMIERGRADPSANLQERIAHVLTSWLVGDAP